MNALFLLLFSSKRKNRVKIMQNIFVSSSISVCISKFKLAWGIWLPWSKKIVCSECQLSYIVASLGFMLVSCAAQISLCLCFRLFFVHSFSKHLENIIAAPITLFVRSQNLFVLALFSVFSRSHCRVLSFVELKFKTKCFLCLQFMSNWLSSYNLKARLKALDSN